ncbi:MAG: helix-turn-helix domain-containing protein [Verrucomicrobiales bacterium]|nr:helix-turn-helix domain-containing protein [Verrucomicrobiales bacterium]
MQIRSVKELGALVKSRRNALGWSQQKLADETGVQRLWIVQFEKGKSTAHIGLVFRALRALDITLEVDPQPGVAATEEEEIDLSSILGEAD